MVSPEFEKSWERIERWIEKPGNRELKNEFKDTILDELYSGKTKEEAYGSSKDELSDGKITTKTGKDAGFLSRDEDTFKKAAELSMGGTLDELWESEGRNIAKEGLRDTFTTKGYSATISETKRKFGSLKKDDFKEVEQPYLTEEKERIITEIVKPGRTDEDFSYVKEAFPKEEYNDIKTKIVTVQKEQFYKDVRDEIKQNAESGLYQKGTYYKRAQSTYYEKGNVIPESEADELSEKGTISWEVKEGGEVKIEGEEE